MFYAIVATLLAVLLLIGVLAQIQKRRHPPFYTRGSASDFQITDDPNSPLNQWAGRDYFQPTDPKKSTIGPPPPGVRRIEP